MHATGWRVGAGKFQRSQRGSGSNGLPNWSLWEFQEAQQEALVRCKPFIFMYSLTPGTQQEWSVVYSPQNLEPPNEPSIARLELMSGQMAANMVPNLRNDLERWPMGSTTVCMDSMVHLHWITKPGTPWKVFVGNRVKKMAKRRDTSQLEVTVWVLFTVRWTKQMKQKTTLSVDWRFVWKSWNLSMSMLQALTTLWVLYTVRWAKQMKQKTAISVHWRFNWKTWDLSMFMLQALTVMWVLYTVRWAKQMKQKTTSIRCGLETSLKRLGPEHVYVASSYNNLSTLH